jgi:hypothetical protein
VTHFSYGRLRGRSFNPTAEGVEANTIKRIENMLPRLKNVTVQGGDYEAVIRKYDSPNTAFFLDPPYAGYDVHVGEKKFDEERFFNILKSIKGKFLLTYGIRGKLPGLLKGSNFRIKRIVTRRDIRSMRGVEGPKVLTQLLVSNYTPVGKQLEAASTDGVSIEDVDRKEMDKAVWSTAYINDLPDSAFLYIESGGRKDEDGKTVPRTLRHFPIYDDEGNLDLPHLRNAIARIPQARIPGLTASDLSMLQDKARRMLEEAQKGTPSPPSDKRDTHVGESCRGGEGLFHKEMPLIKNTDPNDERYVLGIVLEPETVDAQGDIYSAEEIRRAAHKFMQEFGGLGVMHRFRANDQVKILESFLAPTDLTIDGARIKKGTWLLAVRVLSDELWKQVKNGTYSGFSIGGSARRHPEKPTAKVAKRSAQDSRPKTQDSVNRLHDMVVVEVSLVDRAANKRRFLIVKRSDPMGKRTKKSNTPANDGIQDAIKSLEVLAEAGEALAEAGEAHSPELVTLASRLLKVSERIVEAAESADDDGQDDGEDDALDAVDEGGDEDLEDDDPPHAPENEEMLTKMETTLGRMNALLDAIEKGDATPPPSELPKPPASDDQQTRDNGLAQVLDAVKKQQRRLARLEKQYGLPNSLPSGESRGSPDENESWPRDLNAPVDRESVDKSVSFHDAGRRKS